MVVVGVKRPPPVKRGSVRLYYLLWWYWWWLGCIAGAFKQALLAVHTMVTYRALIAIRAFLHPVILLGAVYSPTKPVFTVPNGCRVVSFDRFSTLSTLQGAGSAFVPGVQLVVIRAFILGFHFI